MAASLNRLPNDRGVELGTVVQRSFFGESALDDYNFLYTGIFQVKFRFA